MGNVEMLRVVNGIKREDGLCWVVDGESGEVRWRGWKDGGEFFDPARNVFGIFIEEGGERIEKTEKKPTQK